MNLLGLSTRNLWRSPVRTALTVLGVAIAILVFVLLRTVISTWDMAAEIAAKDRIATRHRLSFVVPVSKREREIGTLRALGFGKRSIVTSFVLEAALLGGLGGLVGASLALALGFVRFSVVNAQSWNETSFSFEPTWSGAFGAVFAAMVMGVLGGLLPALRAARLPLVRALRG